MEQKQIRSHLLFIGFLISFTISSRFFNSIILIPFNNEDAFVVILVDFLNITEFFTKDDFNNFQNDHGESMGKNIPLY